MMKSQNQYLEEISSLTGKFSLLIFISKPARKIEKVD